MGKKSIIWSVTKDEFIQIANTSLTLGDILEHFNLKPFAGNYRTLKRRIVKENIDVSHIVENVRRFREKQAKKLSKKVPLEEILVENSDYKNSSLKKRLIEENLLTEICYECGQLPIWNGKPLTLQLEHKNGNKFDNRLENLCLLCPNCHSQTDTFAGRNLKVDKKEYKCKKCSEVVSKSNKTGYCRSCATILIYERKKVEKKSCITCKEPITGRGKNNFCVSCTNKSSRKVERPSKEELQVLICKHPFTTLAEMFGVSDNAIRKWCKAYDLPTKYHDIKKLKEELQIA